MPIWLAQFIQEWGPALAFLVVVVLAEATRRAVYRMEGRTEAWASRLDNHSGDISANTAEIAKMSVRVESLDAKMDDYAEASSKAHLQLESKIDHLAKEWSDNCRQCEARLALLKGIGGEHEGGHSSGGGKGS